MTLVIFHWGAKSRKASRIRCHVSFMIAVASTVLAARSPTCSGWFAKSSALATKASDGLFDRECRQVYCRMVQKIASQPCRRCICAQLKYISCLVIKEYGSAERWQQRIPPEKIHAHLGSLRWLDPQIERYSAANFQRSLMKTQPSRTTLARRNRQLVSV